MKRYIQPCSREHLLLITRSQFLKQKRVALRGRECMSKARKGDLLLFYMENIYHQSWYSLLCVLDNFRSLSKQEYQLSTNNMGFPFLKYIVPFFQQASWIPLQGKGLVQSPQQYSDLNGSLWFLILKSCQWNVYWTELETGYKSFTRLWLCSILGDPRAPPHSRETKTVLESGFHAVDSGFHVVYSSLCQWNLDSEISLPIFSSLRSGRFYWGSPEV